MAPERRQKVLLGVLVVALAAAAIYWVSGGPAASTPAASNRRAAAGGVGTSNAITAPDVHLEALDAPRPEPGGADRNLFRFQSRVPAAAERPPSEAADPVDASPPASGLPEQKAVVPIDLKFIGVMEAPERSLRLAVLSDGRGIYRGREGDIIEGRYRIIRIGAESIEMTYLDGSGRQLIRLSGS